MNFFDTVIEVLKQNERFFSAEGELLRNSVYEAAMKMDADLLKSKTPFAMVLSQRLKHSTIIFVKNIESSIPC